MNAIHTTEAKVDGKTYTVSELETGELSRQSLVERGWDGKMYQLVGKRGAMYLGYRSAEDGSFLIVCKA